MEANTRRAASVLAGYCVGMIGVSSFNFLQRFHFAWGDYRTPTVVSVFVLGIDVGLSLWLKETALGVAGLALANSAAFSLGSLVLFVHGRGILKGISARPILATLLKTIAAVLPAAAGLFAMRVYWGNWWVDGSSVANLVRRSIVGVLAVALTLGMLFLLKVEAAFVLFRTRSE